MESRAERRPIDDRVASELRAVVGPEYLCTNADDLDRYLNGESIQGRRESLLRRLRRKARRNPAATVILLGSLLVLMATGSYGLATRMQVQRERRTAEARARLAQELGQDIKDMEWFVRAVRLLPMHDTSYADTLLRERIGKLRGLQHGLGETGDALVEYALGNAHLARLDFDRAYESLDSARKKGLDSAELQWALGRTLGEQYAKQRDQALSIERAQIPEGKRKELESKYLVPAVAALRASQGGKVGATPFVDGLIALYSKQYDEAIQRADEAARQAPWLYEAKKLAGDAFFSRAVDHIGRLGRTVGSLGRRVVERPLRRAKHFRQGFAFVVGQPGDGPGRGQ